MRTKRRLLSYGDGDGKRKRKKKKKKRRRGEKRGACGEPERHEARRATRRRRKRRRWTFVGSREKTTARRRIWARRLGLGASVYYIHIYIYR